MSYAPKLAVGFPPAATEVFPQLVTTPALTTGTGDWQKAVIVGSVIGVCVEEVLLLPDFNHSLLNGKLKMIQTKLFKKV